MPQPMLVIARKLQERLAPKELMKFPATSDPNTLRTKRFCPRRQVLSQTAGEPPQNRT